MGDPVSIALITSAMALQTGVSLHQVEKQREATAEAEKRATLQADAQKKALEDKKKADEANQAALAANNAKRQAQRQAAGGSMRSGTILTSPLGVQGGAAPAQAGGKTLLGA